MSNTFGNIFKLTTFGESHGPVIGGIIDGMPPGIDIDMEFIQNEVKRRSPGQSSVVTQRKEEDIVEVLSGVFEGKSTGCPIGFIVKNTDMKSDDYSSLKYVYRPSHADKVYAQKYGVRDYRGGGRSSARITIARVVAGAFAKLVLNKIGIDITAYTSQIGHLKLHDDYTLYDLSNIDDNPVRCPDEDKVKQMEDFIKEVKKASNSVGGVVTCVVKGCPVGLGEPEFGKLHAQLGGAMLSINAAKGFEYGVGFDCVNYWGTKYIDKDRDSNHDGGINGGISNGKDIYFRVAFKPTPSVGIRGRHDPCIVPRAVPIVEAMAAMVLLDNYLISKAWKE